MRSKHVEESNLMWFV